MILCYLCGRAIRKIKEKSNLSKEMSNNNSLPFSHQRETFEKLDGPGKGYIYSSFKNNDPEETAKKLPNLKKKEKSRIANSNLSNLYTDPLEEFDNRIIPYSKDEISGFENFLETKFNSLKKISDYSKKKVLFQEENEKKTITIAPIEIEKILEKIPEEILEDPFGFFSGDFKNELRNFPLIVKILIAFLPLTVEPDIQKRKKFKLQSIIEKATRAGMKWVAETIVGEKKSPKYIIQDYRLQDVTVEEHLADKEKNKNSEEDISTVKSGEFMAAIEDRLNGHLVIVPNGKFFSIGCLFFNT